MRNQALAFALLLGLAGSVPAQTPAQKPDPVQHARATVAHLHDTALSPPSFVLENVYLTKPSKYGRIGYCYAFSSKDKSGDSLETRAAEHGPNNTLSFFTSTNGAGKYFGYDDGFKAPCSPGNIAREITAEVNGLAPPVAEPQTASGAAPATAHSAALPPDADLNALIQQANRDFADYQRLNSEGRFSDAGQKLEDLRQVLSQLSARAK